MKKNLKAYIDRIEGDIAVVYIGENEDYKFDLPIKYLPENIKENTRLKITISTDEKSGDTTAKEVEDLRKMLIEGS